MRRAGQRKPAACMHGALCWSCPKASGSARSASALFLLLSNPWRTGKKPAASCLLLPIKRFLPLLPVSLMLFAALTQ